ncbi:FxLD family lantipeptide [Streptomyces olivaceus]
MSQNTIKGQAQSPSAAAGGVALDQVITLLASGAHSPTGLNPPHPGRTP